jgi:hypothetical protein
MDTGQLATHILYLAEFVQVLYPSFWGLMDVSWPLIGIGIYIYIYICVRILILDALVGIAIKEDAANVAFNYLVATRAIILRFCTVRSTLRCGGHHLVSR